MNKEIVLLIGRAGAGKDSVCNILCETWKDRKILRLGFADRIKESLSKTFHVPLHYFHDRILKEQPLDKLHGMSPRDACKKYGLIMRKHFWDSVWLDHVITQIKQDEEHDLVIVTDGRFLNEAAVMKDLNATMFYCDAEKRLGPVDKDAGPSETEQYLIKEQYNPTVLNNNGTYDEFVKEVLLKFVR